MTTFSPVIHDTHTRTLKLVLIEHHSGTKHEDQTNGRMCQDRSSSTCYVLWLANLLSCRTRLRREETRSRPMYKDIVDCIWWKNPSYRDDETNLLNCELNFRWLSFHISSGTIIDWTTFTCERSTWKNNLPTCSSRTCTCTEQAEFLRQWSAVLNERMVYRHISI